MNLLWAFGILVVADALAIAALLLIRRGAPEGSYFADGDRASGVFGVLATGFAIFAGFVIFLAFTRYDESRSGAEAEALWSSSNSKPRSHFRRRSAPGCPVSSSATGVRWRTRSGRAWRREAPAT